MAKAKRQRRNSIRTMSGDASVLDVLESLERAERAEATAREADDATTGGEPVAEAEKD